MKYFTCDRSTRDKAFKYYVTSKISENMHETPEGFLVCLGVPIARTGPMTYGEGETPLEVGDGGTIEIDRSEDEVFKPETIASFEGKPVTITHPTEFVTPQNWSRLAKGILQNVRRGEGEQKNDLIADLLITDQMAINLVKNGLREVSCGYEADYTQTGEGQGKQSKIIGNHLALVDEGRAGSSYAINDHKGVTMKLSDKIKAIFAKAQDEAMKIAEDEAGGEKKDVKKDESKDAMAYDELKKSIDALVEKVAAMGQPTTAAKDDKKDGDDPAVKKEGEKKEGKDADVAASLEDRLKALEASVSKLLEGKAEAGDADEGEESEESEDEYGEESEDDSMSNGMTGDTASRIEILAPGMDAKAKDEKAVTALKKKAIETAYATKDGKKAISALTGGKAPTLDSAEKVEALFISASELLKAQRTQDFSKTKQTRDSELVDGTPSASVMTPEKMNELNAKHYQRSH